MGGTIEVFSEIDKGSLFRVELELRIPDEQDDNNFWSKNGISRILAVDDEKEICQGIQTLMRDTGVYSGCGLWREGSRGGSGESGRSRRGLSDSFA